jgi:hypothetical protein
MLRFAPLLLVIVLQLLMVNDVLHGQIWPPKEALMVGDKLVGRLARVRDPEIPILSVSGYDPQFYWAIAQDPFMRDPQVLQSLDATAYRYQRILFPLAAWLIPGDTGSLAYRLWGLAVAGWLVGAWAMWRLASQLRVSRPIALALYACNAGLLFSVLHPLPDVWAAALGLWGLLLWMRGRLVSATVLFALAGLTKETALLVPAAVILLSLARGKMLCKENWIAAVAFVPDIVWQIALRVRLGVWSTNQSINNLDLPYVALVKVAFTVLLNRRGALDFFVAVGLAGLALYSLIRIGRPRTLLQSALWAQAALVSIAGSAVLEGIGSSSRASILFLVLFGLWRLRPAPEEAAAFATSGARSLPLHTRQQADPSSGTPFQRIGPHRAWSDRS